MKIKSNSWSAVVLSILLAKVFSACGNNNVKLQMGPKLKKAVEDSGNKLKAETDRNALYQEVSRCGVAVNSDAARKEEILGSSSVKIEPSVLKPAVIDGVDRKVISIEANLFSLENLRPSIKNKNPLLEASFYKQTDGEDSKLAPMLKNKRILALSSNIDGDRSVPIVIRAKCFEIKKDEVLLTLGRNLYIAAEKVILDGIVRTSALSKDDTPGSAGGSLFIAATFLEVGPLGRLDVRGGDAGVIRKAAGFELHSDNENFASDLKRFLERHFVYETRIIENRRFPVAEPEEAERILTAFELAYPSFQSTVIHEAEYEIYDDFLKLIDPHQPARQDLINEIEKLKKIRGTDRLAFDFKRDELLRRWPLATKIWERRLNSNSGELKNIQAGARKLESRVLGGENPEGAEKVFENWIVDGKLAVTVSTKATRYWPKSVDQDGAGVIKAELARFGDLRGGASGGLELVYGFANKAPSVVSGEGLSSYQVHRRDRLVSSVNLARFEIEPLDKSIKLLLDEKRVYTFHFLARRGGSVQRTLSQDITLDESNLAFIKNWHYLDKTTGLDLYLNPVHTDRIIEQRKVPVELRIEPSESDRVEVLRHPAEAVHVPNRSLAEIQVSDRPEDILNALDRWGIRGDEYLQKRVEAIRALGSQAQ